MKSPNFDLRGAVTVFDPFDEVDAVTPMLYARRPSRVYKQNPAFRLGGVHRAPTFGRNSAVEVLRTDTEVPARSVAAELSPACSLRLQRRNVDFASLRVRRAAAGFVPLGV